MSPAPLGLQDLPSPALLLLPEPQANHSQGCQTLPPDGGGLSWSEKGIFQSHPGTQIIYKIQGFVCGLATELKHAWKSQAGVKIMGPWVTILMCHGMLRDGQDRPALSSGPSRRRSTGVIWWRPAVHCALDISSCCVLVCDGSGSFFCQGWDKQHER